ncbi:MAG: PDGLE domain-containing protein [Micromonosporaceae bacterium]|nr:PDGLE domain-containing protein [Micromonosporaceae bacterium]
MRRHRAYYAIGLLVCLLIAGVASFYASGSPDGLEKVAAEQGFEDTAEDHALADWPLADYAARGVDSARLAGGLAGAAGVGLTLILAGGLFWFLARRNSATVGGSAAVTDGGSATVTDGGSAAQT